LIPSPFLILVLQSADYLNYLQYHIILPPSKSSYPQVFYYTDQIIGNLLPVAVSVISLTGIISQYVVNVNVNVDLSLICVI